VATEKHKFFCNFDIPGTQHLDPANLDVNTVDAIIFIQNTSKNVTNPFAKISSFINLEQENIKNKTFVVLRHPSLSKSAKSTFISFQCYNFFELNQHSLQFVEYDPDVQGESENGYWAVLSDLAYDIKFISQTSGENKSDKNQTIYLAEVSHDQLKNRERIKRELLFSGFRVLPMHPLPAKLEDFEKKVKELLAESILSINILGEQYGESPEGTDYSYPELQNRTFSKYYSDPKSANDRKISRIIWMPPSLDSYDDKQTQYLNRIKKEITTSHNTELVQSTIFDLKEIIEKKVKKSQFSAFELIKEENKQEVMIVFLKADEMIHLETISVFNKKAIPYKIFNFESTDLENLSSFMTLLKLQKHILIISNEKPDKRLSSTMHLIVRSKGYSDAIPFSSFGLFLPIKNDNTGDYLPVDIQNLYFEKSNLQEKLESYLSNIKL
jgi:hypothetical protein